ncbi:MAG: glycosyltransferase family 39 protein [Chloroflexi bacterium]|nr:glycosyltransferase family 39 protein [Chloroflexota bacterium]
MSGAQFCSSCGWRAAHNCPTCRSAVLPDALFCQGCGRRAIRPLAAQVTRSALPETQPAATRSPFTGAAAPVVANSATAPFVGRALAEGAELLRRAIVAPDLEATLRHHVRALELAGQVLVLIAAVLAAAGVREFATHGDFARGGLLLKLAAVSSGVSALAWWRRTPRLATSATATDVGLPMAGGLRAPRPNTPGDRRIRDALLGVGTILMAVELVTLPDSQVLLGTAAWIGSMACFVAAVARPVARPCMPEIRLTRRELGLAGLLVAIGTAARFFNLEGTPSGVHGDETEFGMAALRVLAGNGANPFGVVFLGDPAMFAYVQAGSIALFGRTITALRLTAAVASALTLPLYYLFSRSLFGARIALIAVALMSSAYTVLNFSHMALNVIEVPLFGLAMVVCMWRGLRTGGGRWFLLAGLAAGLGAYFHFSARLLPVVAGAVSLFVLLREPGVRRLVPAALGFMTLGYLAAVLPAATYFHLHVEDLLRHHQNQAIFLSLKPGAGPLDVLSLLVDNAEKTFEGFLYKLDESQLLPTAGEPSMSPLISPLLTLGLGAALFRVRDFRWGLMLVWFFAGSLGAILSDGAPHVYRMFASFPPLFLIVALGLERIRQAVVGLSRGHMTRLATVVMVAFVGAAMYYDFDSFFRIYPREYPWGGVTWAGRFAESMTRDTLFLNAGSPFLFAGHGDIQYFGYGMELRDLQNPTVELPALGKLDRPLAVAVNVGLKEWVPVVDYYAPENTQVRLPDQFGRLEVFGFTIPAGTQLKQPDGAQGLRGVIQQEGSAQLTRVDPAIVFRKASALAGEKPFRGVWTGLLLAPDAGRYDLELFSDGPTRLTIDGVVVLEGGVAGEAKSLKTTRALTLGSHRIELDYRYVRERGFLELYWRPPDGERALIPPSALRPA